MAIGNEMEGFCARLRSGFWIHHNLKTAPARRVGGFPVFLLPVLGLALLPQQARAVAKTWACGNNSWHISSCWSPVGAPEGGDSAYLTQSGATDRTVLYYNTTQDYSVTPLDQLRVNATGADSMTLHMHTASGYSLQADWEYIGLNGNCRIHRTLHHGIRHSWDNYGWHGKTKHANKGKLPLVMVI